MSALLLCYYICFMLDDIFHICNPKSFENNCLETFRYQYDNTEVYGQYVDLIGVNPNAVQRIEQIPFLPISCFKTHKIISKPHEPQTIFSSSGTSGMTASRHFVADISLYKKSYIKGFKHFYGSPSDYCILALLPSYLEREGSSLIYMVDDLIKQSKYPQSGFYLDEFDQLASVLSAVNEQNIPCILLGVSYALLDLADLYPMDLCKTIIMETGGMKGNRPELSKNQLHQALCEAFNSNKIHSEYGMTELLSQAYSKGDGLFSCPPWMQVRIRDPYDPFSNLEPGRAGGINIIDLANQHACAFIQTDDLGELNQDGYFKVLGRMEASEIRGCNLLIQ